MSTMGWSGAAGHDRVYFVDGHMVDENFYYERYDALYRPRGGWFLADLKSLARVVVMGFVWVVLFLLATAFILTYTMPLMMSLGAPQDGWTFLWAVLISAAAPTLGLLAAWAIHA